MDTDAGMYEDRPVVVGVDGSRAAPAVVDLAAAEATRRRSPLVIVHVWPGRYTGSFRGRGSIPARADAQRLLDLSEARVRRDQPWLEVRTQLLDGGPANLLAETSRHSRLLVVGHRDALKARTGWGPTTAYLAHHSACPVLVHRGRDPGPGPVVVATSARAGAGPTLEYAFALASGQAARLVALHMWTRPGAAEGVPPVVAAGAYSAESATAGQELDGALAEWIARYPRVRVERLLVNELDMPYTVEGAMRRGRVLVAGIGRSGSFAELLYESWRPAARQRAGCPVVLVPPGWHEPTVAADASAAGSG
ncbi:universal stress protein [Actinoplanes sp. LDG1-06]|uniref:Universal stress protein n=1 Tax=Paractinoplanes ovalisporus TaxID=2810368 RepID=A0ABS2A966_9ACTN|nr:universal stress protein [Actinoplanes ovalisporus]MBM2616379.1 universal stress protein [Actinoplanes ovalisporus]